ncbi:hypothetical protein Q5A_000365 [Serratia inhibens PRI-2C]|uniref:DUF1471 domain-containing protein n=2 Tax=Serratia TaxID=613 RepID=A0AA92X3C5_9GAMM|nr:MULTISPECIES: DUF1471 domain-containing protein [Serratia]ANS40593.1 hypothetical protein Q5A_000365 [Serratia inhibens PRI-2C]QPS85970.1 DUF1471 domain-containing protein [Serratia plymuthica]RJF55040.1 DUF1471 domain-containing protein [Serratia inhibens]
MSNLTDMMTNIEKYLSPYIISSGKQSQSVGFITLNQNVVSLDDATAYRIIALHEPDSNSTLHVSAELYH